MLQSVKTGSATVASPADLMPKTVSAAPPAPAPPAKPKDAKSIWDEDEVSAIEDVDDAGDDRKRPE